MSGVAWWAVPALAAGAAAWLACPAPPPALARTAEARPRPRWAPPVLLAGTAAAVALAAAGAVPVGWLVLGLVGTSTVLGGQRIWRRRRARAFADATSRHVLDACEVVAAELSAGRPPEVALDRATQRWSGLAPVVEAHALGSDVAEALRRAAVAPGAAELRVVASAWQVSQHSGQGLADALSRVGARIRARRRTRRVVISELASARATARLVAALPVVALGMGSGAGGDPWAFLSGTPLGWACLALGLGCGLVGLWWIEAIADRVDVG